MINISYYLQNDLKSGDLKACRVNKTLWMTMKREKLTVHVQSLPRRVAAYFPVVRSCTQLRDDLVRKTGRVLYFSEPGAECKRPCLATLGFAAPRIHSTMGTKPLLIAY